MELRKTQPLNQLYTNRMTYRKPLNGDLEVLNPPRNPQKPKVIYEPLEKPDVKTLKVADLGVYLDQPLGFRTQRAMLHSNHNI